MKIFIACFLTFLIYSNAGLEGEPGMLKDRNVNDNGFVNLTLADRTRSLTIRVYDNFNNKVSSYKFLGRDFVKAPLGYIKNKVLELPAGHHIIKLSTSGIKPVELDINVVAGKVTPVVVRVVKLRVNGYHNDRTGISGDVVIATFVYDNRDA